MKEDISYLRKTYKRGEVFFSTLKNPFNLFKSWFNEAKEDKLIDEVNAMTLSTIGIDDFPKGRVVLLKEYGLDGLRDSLLDFRTDINTKLERIDDILVVHSNQSDSQRKNHFQLQKVFSDKVMELLEGKHGKQE